MLALGSPLHAYDLDLLRGGLVARRARDGEKVRTLDGVERTLSAEDLVIADGERAVGLAGIMGGEETEVSSTTTNVLLEAANFEPVGILRSSERHALRTEGSNRWEKGVDPYVAGPAATYATQLIVELAGARWTGAEDVHGELPEPAVIRLRPERASGLIGLDVAADEQAEILAPIGFERLESGYRVPTWRARDVTREVDLIEEVARFQLTEIPFTLPRREAMFGRLTRAQRLRRLVEDVLVGAGYAEAYTPTSSPRATSGCPSRSRPRRPRSARVLYASLLEPARRNADAGEEDVALFEVARVYRASAASCPTSAGTSPASPTAASPRRSGPSSRSTRALGIEPPTSGRASRPSIPGKAARTAEGWLGELHPALLDGDWGAFELDLDALAEAAPHVAAFAEVSPYPEVRQDLAFIVDEDVPASESSPRSARRPASCCASSRSSTSTAASRSARGSGRSRSGSPSARSKGRSRTRTSRPCGRRSSTRSRRGSAPCCAPSYSSWKWRRILSAVRIAIAAPTTAPTITPTCFPRSAVWSSSLRRSATASVSLRRSSAISCLSSGSVAIAQRLGRQLCFLDRLLRQRLRALLQEEVSRSRPGSRRSRSGAEHDEERAPRPPAWSRGPPLRRASRR